MRIFCDKHKLLFIPSVGPGYDDTGIRPWNVLNRKRRKDGQYYTNMWNDAISSNPDAVSITSYNEWGEGTQIEPAVTKIIEKKYINVVNSHSMKTDQGDFRKYEDYGAYGPNYYIDMTRKFSKKLLTHLKKMYSKVPLLQRSEASEKLEL